jgi:hypothetical protein
LVALSARKAVPPSVGLVAVAEASVAEKTA